MTSPLVEPVEKFIADLAPELERIATDLKMGADQPAARDVTMEAYNLAAAFIDADGLHTDDELWAFVQTFAPHFDSMLQYATPADVRAARLVVGRRQFLQKPSLLFEILLSEDHRRSTTFSWRYYESALSIAHTVSSLDLHPSQDELDTIDAFRGMMLEKMDHWAVPRPGTQLPRTGTPSADPNDTSVVAPTTKETPVKPIEALLAELDALVGLEPVKAEVRQVTNLLRVQRLRKDRGLPVVESSYHLVFTGNPGTGKTTVARLVAQIYRSLGVVTKGQLVETDRSSLVAGYVGQTAIQVHKIAETAFGGVLLIDEAYALARGTDNDFGQEAIDTLVKMIEDHRSEFVVIAAGYPDEMHHFIESNPGLRSRFPKTIFFPDYSTADLVAILETMTKAASYELAPDAVEQARKWFDAQVRDKGFGNARLARNLFESAVARQAGRIVNMKDPTNADLCALTADDIGAAEATRNA